MDFTALARSFAKAGTDILGVSADPVARQDAFKRKHKLKIPLASDETLKVLKAYGVWGEKSMYGRKFMGITRTTLLIGPDGRIARIWPKVQGRRSCAGGARGRERALGPGRQPALARWHSSIACIHLRKINHTPLKSPH